MRLMKIAKRGPDKVLSDHEYLSASLGHGKDHTMTRAAINFQDLDSFGTRYRVFMDREEAVHLRELLNDWIEGLPK